MDDTSSFWKNGVPQPFGPQWLQAWIVRHQHPVSFYLHMLGIPMTLLAAPAFLWGEWLWSAILFMGGYLLQFLGHAIEGNDPGEVILLKKQFGYPYIAIVPRLETAHSSRS